jgi:hypothetical protein
MLLGKAGFVFCCIVYYLFTHKHGHFYVCLAVSVGFGEEKLFFGLLNVLVKTKAALGPFWWQTGMPFLPTYFSFLFYNQNSL